MLSPMSFDIKLIVFILTSEQFYNYKKIAKIVQKVLIYPQTHFPLLLTSYITKIVNHALFLLTFAYYMVFHPFNFSLLNQFTLACIIGTTQIWVSFVTQYKTFSVLVIEILLLSILLTCLLSLVSYCCMLHWPVSACGLFSLFFIFFHF